MKKVTFYAVHKGHQTGVFNSWPKCQAAVNGYSDAKHRKFTNKEDANYYVEHGEAPCSRPKAINENGKKLVSIYTDGSCIGGLFNEIGSGIIVYSGGAAVEAYYGLHDCSGTNNISELNGLKAGLEKASGYVSVGYEVEILTDSNYALKCVTKWSNKWKLNGWKNVKNKMPDNLELIKECHQMYEVLKGSLSIKHVRAHAGIEGNEAADRLADIAVNTGQELLIEIPVSDIFKTE